MDDTGEFVPGDFVTALLAESMLEKEPGGTIIYDVRASWAVRDVVERLGGTALPNRVGHAFIKLRMREVDAVFAGEVSGHYYFRDFYQADSGTIPALLMLELVSKRGQKLSELLRPFRERYFLTGELNTPVADVALTLQRLKEHFADQGEVSHLDGISITAEDWHLNVRPSNTEPLLRLNLEALDPELMERKRDEALAVIAGEGPALTAGLARLRREDVRSDLAVCLGLERRAEERRERRPADTQPLVVAQEEAARESRGGMIEVGRETRARPERAAAVGRERDPFGRDERPVARVRVVPEVVVDDADAPVRIDLHGRQERGLCPGGRVVHLDRRRPGPALIRGPDEENVVALPFENRESCQTA